MISRIKDLLIKYRQFLLYCVVGASNTLITLLVSFLLTQYAGFSGAAASVPAYTAGIVNGYVWSTRTVFRTKGTVVNFAKFVAVNALMIGLNFLLVWLFERKLGLGAFVSQVLATPFTFIGNYTLNRLWTFSRGNGN